METLAFHFVLFRSLFQPSLLNLELRTPWSEQFLLFGITRTTFPLNTAMLILPLRSSGFHTQIKMPLAAVLEAPHRSAPLFFGAPLEAAWRAGAPSALSQPPHALFLLWSFVHVQNKHGLGMKGLTSQCQQGNQRSCKFNDMEEVTLLEPDSWGSTTCNSWCDYIGFCSHLPIFLG